MEEREWMGVRMGKVLKGVTEKDQKKIQALWLWLGRKRRKRRMQESGE